MGHQVKDQPSRRAIVIGGSIAGLFAARVLLNHFKQVTLQLARLIANPWSMATTEDCRGPTAEGLRPNWVGSLLQRCGDQVVLLATERHDVFQTFARVVHLIAPPSDLFHPKIATQVLAAFSISV